MSHAEQSPADPLFAPLPGHAWQRISPRYATVKRISSTISTVVTCVIAGVAAWFWYPKPWVFAGIAVVGVAWLTWRLVRAGRWVRSWGYAHRDRDLCLTHGLLTKELTIVPFGRMQMVTVNAGPIERLVGLATVELVTASPHSSASIPGLPAADAAALRDQLIELADAGGSGL